jgi:hypothetical protein
VIKISVQLSTTPCRLANISDTVLDIPVGTMTSCYDEVLADYDPPTHELSKMEERHLVRELLDGRCRPSNDPTVKLLHFGGA